MKLIINNILRKTIPVIVILVFLILIILGIWGITALLGKVQLEEYNKYQNNMEVLTQKIVEISKLGQNRLGINLQSTQAQITYADEINEIKQLFGIDVVNENYYLLEENHKQLMGLESFKEVCVVNYDSGMVFCLEPMKYKGIKYYTTNNTQRRLLKDYTYDFPIILDGFEHIEGTWDTGYVIVDELGNEFVWVPVGVLNIQKPSDAFKKYYLDKNKETEITQEYQAILDSIDKYGGYYIARYESSLTGATNKTSMGTTNVLQVKKNVIPTTQVSVTTSDIEQIDNSRGYNVDGKSVQVGQRKGAIELARSMSNDYKWEDRGIHSTLMYAEHYDTLIYIANSLGLIKNVEGKNAITQDSTSLGNYINSTFKYEYIGEMLNKNVEEGILLPTGTTLSSQLVSNKVFNVYDLAGNLQEWTMYNTKEGYATRGGSYSLNGEDDNISEYVYQASNYASASLGIRVVLYID